MKLIQRTEQLYEIPIGYVKAYLIRDDKELVLIDTGIPGKADAILRAIKDAGMDISLLKHIILTQLHLDHVGSLHDLKDRTGALVYAHELEAPAIEEGVTMRACTPTPALLSRILYPFIIKGADEKKIRGTMVDVRVKDGDILDIAGGIRVIHTPGHTNGHMALLLEREEKILIAGDCAGGGRKPGYPMLFEDPVRGLESLKNIGNMGLDRIYLSHGKSFEKDASEVFKNSFRSFPQ